MTSLGRTNGVRRSEILQIIKRNGVSSVKQLSNELGISHVAVRQHLVKLVESGYVTIHTRPEHPGRPVHFYMLTDKGDEQFPREYQKLVKELLSELSQWQGEETVENLLKRRQLSIQGQLCNHLELDDSKCKVHAYCELMNERGFMVSHEALKEDSHTLTFGNCVLSSVAKDYPAICCQGDITNLQSIIGNATIECLQHRNQGDTVCKFKLITSDKSSTLEA